MAERSSAPRMPRLRAHGASQGFTGSEPRGCSGLLFGGLEHVHGRKHLGRFSGYGPFWGPFCKGAVVYWGPKKGPYFRELLIWKSDGFDSRASGPKSTDPEPGKKWDPCYNHPYITPGSTLARSQAPGLHIEGFEVERQSRISVERMEQGLLKLGRGVVPHLGYYLESISVFLLFVCDKWLRVWGCGVSPYGAFVLVVRVVPRPS